LVRKVVILGKEVEVPDKPPEHVPEDAPVVLIGGTPFWAWWDFEKNHLATFPVGEVRGDEDWVWTEEEMEYLRGAVAEWRERRR